MLYSIRSQAEQHQCCWNIPVAVGPAWLRLVKPWRAPLARGAKVLLAEAQAGVAFALGQVVEVVRQVITCDFKA
jgi:hypothetical protein